MYEAQMMTGGWDYVIAAYSITTVVLAVYAWSLVRRARAESEED